MQANKAVRAFGGRSYFGDGNRGSIAGKDGVFFYDRIQRRKCFLLLFNVLDDGFDDNVTVSKRLSAGRSLEPTTDCLHRLLQVAFFGKLGQRLLDSSKAFIEKRLLLFKHGNVITGGGADLRDAGTHQTTTQNTDFLDRHIPSCRSAISN